MSFVRTIWIISSLILCGCAMPAKGRGDLENQHLFRSIITNQNSQKISYCLLKRQPAPFANSMNYSSYQVLNFPDIGVTELKSSHVAGFKGEEYFLALWKFEQLKNGKTQISLYAVASMDREKMWNDISSCGVKI